MIDSGVYIGTDFEMAVTQKYVITFRRNCLLYTSVLYEVHRSADSFLLYAVPDEIQRGCGQSGECHEQRYVLRSYPVSYTHLEEAGAF